MVVEPADKYVELVTTLDISIEETSTVSKYQTALERELSWNYGEAVVEPAWEALKLRYESLPEVGIAYRRVEMKWGYQGQYVSVDPRMTGVGAGRIMSFEAVTGLLGGR
ncbi:unnamed protein product [marine sediment metagenome]|uniref:Uncharacterized protein n=1 Tax=marine sediment metagenome TaxID=412755 RepID=X1NFW8_9ZZZZ